MSEAARSDPKRCAAPRKDGQPCTVTTLLADGHCFAHSDLTAEARADARRTGGRNSAKIVRLRRAVPPRLMPIFDRLETALAEIHAGSLDPKLAQAMASLARALVAVLTAGELEERVRRLEGNAEQ